MLEDGKNRENGSATGAKHRVAPRGSADVAPPVASFATKELRATAPSIQATSSRGSQWTGAGWSYSSCKATPAPLGAALEEAPPSNAVPGSTVAVDTGPRALDSKAGAPRGTGLKVWVPDQVLETCACVSLDMCPAPGLVVVRKISLVKAASLEHIDFDEYLKT